MTAVNASMSVAILAYLPPTIPRSDMYDGPMPFSVARRNRLAVDTDPL